SGGYYPADLSFQEANEMMVSSPDRFKRIVQKSLIRHVAAINRHAAKGTYFFDYGNAFLLEASRAGADVLAENKTDFRYPLYVDQILCPICYDYGFGQFRWVFPSGDPNDLKTSNRIALDVLMKLAATATPEIEQQMRD